MPWTWVRPADETVLEGRPLLDLGTGDGQTLAALVSREGLVVGIDRTLEILRPGSVNAEAALLPFKDGSVATVLAADVFHHLDDAHLVEMLGEVKRVMRRGGQLVAWWYEHTSDPSPDAPRHPRGFEAARDLVARSGFATVERLDLVPVLAPAGRTVGLVARS